MKMIVCIKQVQDPDIPPRDFKVDEGAKKVIPPPSSTPVISPFDENAVEAAIRLKEANGGTISVLSAGSPSAVDAIKKALAMGCDEGYLVNDPALEGSDAMGSARVLAAACRKIGDFDLILCGRVSADWSTAGTAIALAEALGLPSASQLQKLELADGKVRVERVLADGYEALELPLPALLTISNEIGEARLPSVKGILKASRQTVTTWKAEDLGLDMSEVGEAGSAFELTRLYIPKHEGKCEIIEGESLEEAAEKLALRLREQKII